MSKPPRRKPDGWKGPWPINLNDILTPPYWVINNPYMKLEGVIIMELE